MWKCQKWSQVSITETFGLKVLTIITLLCFIFSVKLVLNWFSGRTDHPLLLLKLVCLETNDQPADP